MPDEAGFSDFGLAVFLTTQPTVKLTRAQQVSANRVCFFFMPKAESERLSTVYFGGQAVCNPRIYHDRSRALKSLLHQIKQGGVR